MQKPSGLVLVLFLFFQIPFVHTFAQNKKQTDWQADIENIREQLPALHHDLFFNITKEYFEKELNEILKKQDQFDDFGIAVKLQQLIAKLGDSHTQLDYLSLVPSDKMLPLHLYWFSDGIFILHTTSRYQKLLGNRIISINDFEITRVVDSLATLITLDNNALLLNNTPGLIPALPLLHFFGFSDNNEVVLTCINEMGDTIQKKMQSEALTSDNRVRFQPDSLAFCWENEKAFFTDKYFSQEQIYYLQYNKCHSRELEEKYGNVALAGYYPSFWEFEEKVFTTLQEQPMEKLVFDMRFNGGGNSYQGTEFIQKLADIKKLNQRGRLFVVIGRRTFSSAIINTMDFKENTQAVFVGEETGGKPNHFGEVKTMVLPSSELRLYYSTKYFRYTKKDINSIIPDFTIETSFEDFKNGVDPVYEFIKNYLGK
jgi:hypothetical protein